MLTEILTVPALIYYLISKCQSFVKGFISLVVDSWILLAKTI